VAQVLLGFDVDACQFAYDGERVLATSAAKRALVSGVNIADPERRAATYENRLCKYAIRGFAVAIPGLEPERVAPRHLEHEHYMRHDGALQPINLGFPSDEDRRRARKPEWTAVGAPVTGLAKLLVLSRLLRTELYPDASNASTEPSTRLRAADTVTPSTTTVAADANPLQSGKPAHLLSVEDWDSE